MAETKPRCRLYLQAPQPLTAKLEAQLSHVIANTSVACILLCDNSPESGEIHADRLIDLVQTAGAACLIENDVALAESLGSDGVHIDADSESYAHAREVLGESANIGVGCGLSKHAAMRHAEMGANYVAFSPDNADIDGIDPCAELIAWWTEIFVVPCVAWNIDDAEQAARLASLGADFVAPSPAIWQADNATATIAEIDDAIRRVRRAA